MAKQVVDDLEFTFTKSRPIGKRTRTRNWTMCRARGIEPPVAIRPRRRVLSTPSGIRKSSTAHLESTLPCVNSLRSFAKLQESRERGGAPCREAAERLNSIQLLLFRNRAADDDARPAASHHPRSGCPRPQDQWEKSEPTSFCNSPRQVRDAGHLRIGNRPSAAPKDSRGS